MRIGIVCLISFISALLCTSAACADPLTTITSSDTALWRESATPLTLDATVEAAPSVLTDSPLWTPLVTASDSSAPLTNGWYTPPYPMERTVEAGPISIYSDGTLGPVSSECWWANDCSGNVLRGAASPAPVPEPSTWALLITGLLLGAWYKYRYRPSSQSL